MKTNHTYINEGYTLRSPQMKDLQAYYQAGFASPDPNVMRLTGSGTFTYEQVENYFIRCLTDESRYDFLILDPQQNIIGESVVNEIDWIKKTANFRIALFKEENCAKGIGAFVIKATLAFAFDEIKLQRLELEVFSFNPRAIRAYQKAGFIKEELLRDAVMDGNSSGDILIMALSDQDYQKIKNRK